MRPDKKGRRKVSMTKRFLDRSGHDILGLSNHIKRTRHDKMEGESQNDQTLPEVVQIRSSSDFRIKFRKRECSKSHANRHCKERQTGNDGAIQRKKVIKAPKPPAAAKSENRNPCRPDESPAKRCQNQQRDSNGKNESKRTQFTLEEFASQNAARYPRDHVARGTSCPEAVEEPSADAKQHTETHARSNIFTSYRAWVPTKRDRTARSR